MKNATAIATPSVPEGLMHAFLRTWSLLRQVQEPYFARFGISGAQWGILRVLQRAELQGEMELPLKVVSERLLVQAPSVTGVVDRLERLGLVKRTPSSEDLRVRYLSLTPRGRELMAEVLKGHPARIRSLFAALEPDEQEAMLRLLKKVHGTLDKIALEPIDTSRATGDARQGDPDVRTGRTRRTKESTRR